MRLLKQILYPAFRFSARHRMPRLAAWLLVLTSRTIVKSDRQNGEKTKKYRVLALSINKSGFLQDIEETFLVSDNFDVVQWPFYAVRAFSDAILSPSLNNKRYLSDDESVEASKDAYRKFLGDLWKRHQAIKPIDVVLSPNYGYYVQRELATALEDLGTPFIVIHKENLKSSGRIEYWQSVYEKLRGKFSGRKILVYNETERELQAASGVADPARIAVTGMPRLDRIHQWRLKQTDRSENQRRPQVLFFSFDKQDKLPTSRTKRVEAQVENRWGVLSWGTLCESTHQAVADLAHRRPDVDFVVKTKSASRHQSDVVKMLEEKHGLLPSNLNIMVGGDAFEALKKSDVVIGFNSTALLEAMAAGIPVVTPRFAEALDANTREFAIDLGNSVEYANSMSEIVDLVCSLIDNRRGRGRELSPDIRRALVQWTGNDDGQAGQRVRDSIRAEIGISSGCNTKTTH